MKTSPRFDAARAQRTLLLTVAALTTAITGFALNRNGPTAAVAVAPAQVPAQTPTQPQTEEFARARAPQEGWTQQESGERFDDEEGHEGYGYSGSDDDYGGGYSYSPGNSGVRMVPQTALPSLGRTRGS